MKQIKKVIKGLPILRDVLKSIHRLVFKRSSFTDFWINKYVHDGECTVVQVGSNDGFTADPISNLILRKKRWKVLFVEPVPYLFEKLKKNYKELSRFQFANVAVNDGSAQSFYFVKQDASLKIKELPIWYDQLGSFNREHILNHLDGIFEPYIEELNVNGLTLDQLFTKYNITNLTLLHIDTEGYDWKILSQLDLKKNCPVIILFEHKHLTKIERGDSIRFLNGNYFIFDFSGDFLCIRKEVVSSSDLKELRKSGKNLTV